MHTHQSCRARMTHASGHSCRAVWLTHSFAYACARTQVPGVTCPGRFTCSVGLHRSQRRVSPQVHGHTWGSPLRSHRPYCVCTGSLGGAPVWVPVHPVTHWPPLSLSLSLSFWDFGFGFCFFFAAGLSLSGPGWCQPHRILLAGFGGAGITGLHCQAQPSPPFYVCVFLHSLRVPPVFDTCVHTHTHRHTHTHI